MAENYGVRSGWDGEWVVRNVSEEVAEQEMDRLQSEWNGQQGPLSRTMQVAAGRDPDGQAITMTVPVSHTPPEPKQFYVDQEPEPHEPPAVHPEWATEDAAGDD